MAARQRVLDVPDADCRQGCLGLCHLGQVEEWEWEFGRPGWSNRAFAKVLMKHLRRGRSSPGLDVRAQGRGV